MFRMPDRMPLTEEGRTGRARAHAPTGRLQALLRWALCPPCGEGPPSLARIGIEVEAFDPGRQFVVRRLDIDPGCLQSAMAQQAGQADEVVRVRGQVPRGEGVAQALRRRVRRDLAPAQSQAAPDRQPIGATPH